MKKDEGTATTREKTPDTIRKSVLPATVETKMMLSPNEDGPI